MQHVQSVSVVSVAIFNTQPRKTLGQEETGICGGEGVTTHLSVSSLFSSELISMIFLGFKQRHYSRLQGERGREHQSTRSYDQIK